MTIGNITGQRGYRLWRALCFAVGVAIMSTGLVDAAQEGDDARVKMEQFGTLSVEITMIESAKEKKGLPVEKATVHILGGNDPRDTNKNGRVSFPKVPTGSVVLTVIVADVATCKISGINISEGEQVVMVQVDKLQEGKCTRLK